MDPTSGQHQSTKWTNATIVELTSVHKVDGPYQRFKTPIHIMDGPNQFIKLYKSTKWTAIRGHDHIPRNGRTQPVHKIIQVHKVDGHQGSRSHSTEWTDPTRFANIIKVYNVGGSN